MDVNVLTAEMTDVEHIAICVASRARAARSHEPHKRIGKRQSSVSTASYAYAIDSSLYQAGKREGCKVRRDGAHLSRVRTFRPSVRHQRTTACLCVPFFLSGCVSF